MKQLHAAAKAGILASALLTASGCDTIQRLSEIGGGPKVSTIENPVNKRDYRPVSMPMPAANVATSSPNSLWRPGARAFFKDQRAGQVGDILTVVVNIKDEKASLSNSTDRNRAQPTETFGFTNLMGLENSVSKILPNTVSPATMISEINSRSTHGSSGKIERQETISVQLAAVVIQALPNGNLVIAGRQEIKVNGELRELAVTGVIRPEDIGSDNKVSSEKMAEARIIYGGRGTLSDVQKPRYGQEVLDIILPF